MAQLARQIDSEQVVDDGDDFERFVAPAGDYMMVPVESVQKEDDDGNVGWRIKWEIVEGEFEGRKVTQFIDIIHADPEKERKSEKYYKRLETALGFKIEDDQDVLDKTLMVRLGFQAGTKQYPNPRNYFNHFWQVGTEPPADTQTRGVSQPQARSPSNAPAPRQQPAGGGRPAPSAPPTRASNPPPRTTTPRPAGGDGAPWRKGQ